MPFRPFDAVTQDARYQQLQQTLQKEQEKTGSIDPAVAQRAAQIYKDAPYIPASVILSISKSGTKPETVEAIKKTAALTTAKSLDPQKPKKKSWFQEVIGDNVKALSRWSFAALNFVPDVAQNIAAQAFSPNDEAGFEGWFKSTQLGTLMSNTKEAGEGFFLGETAMEKQAERARRVRGTINGSAWTIGRGAAEIAFAPGSKPYSLLSGFIDGAVNLGADPTLALGKVSKSVKAARAAIPGVSSAQDIKNAALLARGAAGLDSAEGIAFQGSKFGQFILNDSRAKRFTRRLVENATDESKTVTEKTFFVLENWPGISPAKAKEFAEAADEGQIIGLLGEASARLSNDATDILLPQDIRDVRLARKSAEFLDNRERTPVFRNIRNSKWFSNLPKGSVVINGTGQEKRDAVITYANYMRGVGLGDDTQQFKEVMEKVVSAYSSTDPAEARAASKQAYDFAFETIADHAVRESWFESSSKKLRAVWDAIDDPNKKSWEEFLAENSASWKKPNIPEQKQFVKDIIEASRKARARAYNVNELGRADDGGAFQSLKASLPEGALDDIPPQFWDELSIVSPGALSELADEVQVLPDFRRIRALASNSFITRQYKSGDQRKAVAIAEFVQQEVWKPLALATGGYIMRNMIDAQTRMAMSGNSSLFSHTQDFLMWATRKKGGFDIKGEDFGGVWKGINKEQQDFWDALTFDLHKNLKDPYQAEKWAILNGSFSLASRSVDASAHIDGYVDNLGLIFSDPIESKVAQLVLQNLDQPQRLQQIKDWLLLPENSQKFSMIRDYFRTGVEISDTKQAYKRLISIDAEDDDILTAWVDRLANTKVNTITRNNENLNIVAAYNRVPIMDKAPNGRLVARGKTEIFAGDIDPVDLVNGTDNIGDIVRLPDGTDGLILRKVDDVKPGIDPFTGENFLPETKLVIQPVHPTTAFTKDRLGTNQLRELIDDMGANGELAEIVKRAERGGPSGSSLGNKALEAKNKFVDVFFEGLYGRLTQTLEKSPLFRQEYYKTVFQNTDLMSPESARELLERVTKHSAELGIKPHNYVGGKNVLKKIEEVANSTSDAIGTLEQLDDYAKAVALNETKRILYNATERSNIEDVMRIVVPFGAAWREVLGTYAKAVVEDPTRLRKAQLIVSGGERSDMGIFGGTEGEGFFYKDATTGEYSFNFPLSGTITKLLTGQDVALQAPLKRISIGLGVVPSIGPMAQIAASRIIPDTPSMDFISSILLPYGEKTRLQVTPMWVTRLIEAAEGNTLNLQTVYGNTYIETLRALSASGEYDLADFDEQEKLYADARQKARIITGLRALGQFFGPTSPAPEFKIETLKGDMYGTQLVKEFQKLQSENYDTAVKRFLEIYGNDAILYLSNKTESVAGGLEATDEFGDWERGEGKALINKYRDVAGFMAPGGDNFSFEVWSRQIEKGLRRRLTDREIVELAQYRAAASQYRELRDKLPANPSDEQKAWLRQWRKKLNQEYPGFPVVAEFNPGEFPGKIEQLARLVAEPVLADNDIAKATRTYLKARQTAIQQYVNAGGAESGFKSAIATAPLREWLVDIAKALREEVPEFSRIYDRLLSAEVEE